MAVRNRIILVGGFGNQLFQVAYSLSQANISETEFIYGLGKCSLGLDGLPIVNSFLNLNNPRIFRKVSISFFGNILVALNLRLKSGRFGSKLLDPEYLVSRALSRIVGIFVNSIISNRITIFRTPKLSIGYFQSEALIGDGLKRIREVIKVRKQSAWLSNMVENSKADSPLIVHIRLGDYMEEDDFGIPRKSYFSEAIKLAWDSGNFNKIWVFSNNSERAFDFLPTWCLNYCVCIEEPSGDTLETFEIMRHGKGYVISNSTFSWWAARFSFNNDVQVFAPQPWFKNLCYLEGIYPEAWRKIPSGL
jgi:hypothetical protein